MKKLILTNEEINILRDLQNNLDKKEILIDLENYGLISGTFTDDCGYIFANLTIDGKQLLRALDQHKGLLDDFKVTLDLGIIKIESKN